LTSGHKANDYNLLQADILTKGPKNMKRDSVKLLITNRRALM